MDLGFDLDVNAALAILLAYVPKVLLALLVVIVGFWLARRLSGVFTRTLTKREIDPTVVPFLGNFLTIVIKALVLLSAAAMFGVDVTSFIAIFSALTLAVGLALQSNLSHFASGLLLLAVRPYKVGDVVTVGGNTGKVEAIQLFHTILSTPDNQRYIVPNGKVTGDTITNLSGQGTRGVDLNVGIAYEDDVERARAIILRLVGAHEFVLPEPVPNVVVTGLGDSSVNLLCRPFVLSSNWWATKVQLTEQIKAAFDAEGITIPYPQRTVWMHARDGAAARPNGESTGESNGEAGGETPAATAA